MAQSFKDPAPEYAVKEELDGEVVEENLAADGTLEGETWPWSAL